MYHEFTAPVSFTVSRSGRQLVGFKWASGGCIGLGGPGNAWTNPYLNCQGGNAEHVAGRRVFGQERQVDEYAEPRHQGDDQHDQGRFKTKTSAAGTINFTQKITKTCHGTATFTATLGPAPGALHKKSPGNATTGQSTRPHAELEPQSQFHGRPVPSRYEQQRQLQLAFTVSSGTVNPAASSWRATSMTGPVSGSGVGGTVTATGLFFNVASNQQTVSAFGFSYE